MTRLTIVWPLLIIIAALFWMSQVLGLVPVAINDLLARTWPVLFVALGLMLLLGRRVRFGNLLSLVVCVVLIGGVVTTAYSQQAGKVRTDNQKPFVQAIEPTVTNVEIMLTTLATEVEI